MRKVFSGDRLRELRLAAQIPQSKLAQAVGITVPNYSNWERGLQVPNARYLSPLVETLGCDYGDFFA